MSKGEMLVAGKPVQVWNASLWRQARLRDDVPDEFLADPAVVGPFAPGGGKGGDLMASTVDGHYIIKELNKGDHESLLRITRGYLDRILKGTSLLCTIYLHYTEPASRKSYMVMRNLLSHRGPYLGLYDLKGCADDKTLEAEGRKVRVVHKRIWHVHMWCGNCAWTDDRVMYYHGKVRARKLGITVTDDQRAAIVERLKLDTAWLAQNNLMDYSLLVGLRRLTQAELSSDAVANWARRAPRGELRQPLLYRDGKDIMLLYIGIIDFLQGWTAGKRVAMCLKFMERDKATIPPRPYADRFVSHFSRSFQGGAAPLEPLLDGDEDTSARPTDFLGADAGVGANLQERPPVQFSRSASAVSAVSYYSCISASEMDLKFGVNTPLSPYSNGNKTPYDTQQQLEDRGPSGLPRQVGLEARSSCPSCLSCLRGLWRRA